MRHDDSFLLRFSLPGHGDPIAVSLRPTENLIHPAAKVRYHSAPDPLTGETLTRTEALPPSSVRAYTGHVLHHHSVDSWWKEELASVYRSDWDVERDPRVRGWARVMVLATEGMEYEEDSEELSWTGALEVDGMLWHVRTADAYAAVRGGTDPELEGWASHPHRGLVAWREADVGSVDRATSACAHDSLLDPLDTIPSRPYSQSDFDLLPPLNPSSHSRFNRRQVTGGDIGGSANVSTNFINSIGSTASCPKSAKVVFVGAAADCTYVQKYGTTDAARTQILSNFNSASALYQKSFNVSLGVVELEVMAETCPSTVNSSVPWNVGCPEGGGPGANVDLNTRLSLFSQWRGNKGGGDGAGLWHLMTKCVVSPLRPRHGSHGDAAARADPRSASPG